VSLLADHGICFPIPNAAAQVDDCRAFLNGYPILDLPAPLDTAIAFTPFLLTSQMGVKVATVTLVCIEMLVDESTLRYDDLVGRINHAASLYHAEPNAPICD
jgi:hypothetical protein